MRLFLVISSLAAGGAERVMSTLANGWAREGHHVCLVTLGESDGDFYPVLPQVVRQRLNVKGGLGHPARAFLSSVTRCRKLRKLLRKRSPDAVVAFLTVGNVLAVAAALGLGIPVIVGERSSPEDDFLPAPWRFARRLAYERAAAVVVLTERAAQWLQKAMRGVNARVIANPVVVHRGQEPDAVAGTVLASCHGRKILLAAGRLSAEKGFDLLISAFANLGEIARGWQLVILGEGRERNSLETMIANLHLAEQVLLPGASTSPHALMERADLFVLSSRYEGMPNVLLEAMACGLPCISFDCRTGPSEIITNGADGLLVPPQDVSALSGALAAAMQDAHLRARLAHNAKAAEERFSLESVLRQWNALLRDVTQSAHRA